MTIFDYLDWRGDLLFSERPFNEVDNLILSSLAYLDLEGILTDEEDTLDLPAIHEKYSALGRDQDYLINNPRPLLEKVVRAARFRPVRVGRYINQVDPEKEIQFSAMTFYLDDGTDYVAFRGTDNSIVGWREDFNFALLEETPGQSESVDYLNTAAALSDRPLRVGGHSKGGNFAVYASLFCEKEVRDRILTVYSNDGPGFLHSIADTENYREMIPKIRKIIPENSLIGILLTGYEKKHVVKSSAKGIMQHNPFTWDTFVTRFDPADERSPVSLFMDETLSRWIDALSFEEKTNLISAIFDSIEASGATTVNELGENLVSISGKILDAIKEINKETGGSARESIGKLISAGGGVLFSGIKDTLGEIGKAFSGESNEPAVLALPEAVPESAGAES